MTLLKLVKNVYHSSPVLLTNENDQFDYVQVTSPTTPDYPGLEYPPVFEPGTYSLADASSLLRQRKREAR